MTQEQVYEITRAAVQRNMPAKTVTAETQVYGPLADMDSLDMVDAVVRIERDFGAQGIRVSVAVGDLVGTVTVADLAHYVWTLCQE
jgi:acyl carrier protein